MYIYIINIVFVDLKMVVADVLLWKKWYGGVVVLISASTLWFLFERAGYNLLSFVANVLFLLVVILFFWAKSASLLNRYFLFLLFYCSIYLYIHRRQRLKNFAANIYCSC